MAALEKVYNGREPLGCKAIAVWLLLLSHFQSCLSHVEFQSVNVPNSNAEKHRIITTQQVTIGDLSKPKSSFRKIARTGEDHNCRGKCFLSVGALANNESRYILDYAENSYEFVVNKTSTLFDKRKRAISHSPSGTTMIKPDGSSHWYMIFHFSEPQPGVVYQLELRLEDETRLASREVAVVSFAKEGGVWRPAGATIIPWDGSHLGTEGNPPDAKALEEASCLLDPGRNCLADTHPKLYSDILGFMRYWNVYPLGLQKSRALKKGYESIQQFFKPYAYGYPFLVQINSEGKAISKKLHALGRVGADSILIMPDYRTIYMTGQRGGFFKFVTTKPSDITEGWLYAAKIIARGSTSDSAELNGTTDTINMLFDFSWVLLGRTSEVDISKVSFLDIFHTEDPAGSECPKLNVTRLLHGQIECLEVKSGKEKLAAMLEPVRYAALKHGTMDIFSFSGMTLEGPYSIILASKSIEGGQLAMHVPGSENATPQLTSVEENPCGCLMMVTTDEEYSATGMKTMSCGVLVSDDQNKCSTESLSNPAVLAYVAPLDGVIVGEDSENHENNAVWLHQTQSKQLTRIFTTPLKGSVSSLNWFQDVIGGNNYISINIAHPNDTFGWLGYFGAFDIDGQDMVVSTVPVPYAPGPKGIPQSYTRVVKGKTTSISGLNTIARSREKIVKAGKAGNATQTFRIGETQNKFGQPVDRYEEIRGHPQKFSRVYGEPALLDALSFSTTLRICNRFFAIVNSGSLPASSYIIQLQKEKRPFLGSIVNWAKFGGLWQPSGGSLSPWGTVLGGEAFEPDAEHFERPTCLTGSFNCFKARSPDTYDATLPFLRYFGVYINDLDNEMAELRRTFKPYLYGYATEIRASQYMCTAATKWLTLGRFSHGSLQVMPDQRTVYMTDWTRGDKIGGGFFKFIADTKKDFSRGTLYAAKFTARASTFSIEWIELGSADNAELLERAPLTSFGDIFEYTVFGSRQECPKNRVPVNILSNPECLRVRPGKEQHAAFFETRRYAAYLGATTEWGNLRGVVFDPKSNHLFLSITRIGEGDLIMLQNAKGSPNHLTLGLARCGCLLRVKVQGSSFDAKETMIHSCGRGDIGIDSENACNLELISNPGDLAIIPGIEKLAVAEDSCVTSPHTLSSCGHVNNAVWLLNPRDRSDLTRVMTVPYRSQLSSLHWVAEAKGGGALQAVISQPYDGGKDPNLESEKSTGRMAWFGSFVHISEELSEGDDSSESFCYNDQFEIEYKCPGGKFDFPPAPPPSPSPPTRSPTPSPSPSTPIRSPKPSPSPSPPVHSRTLSPSPALQELPPKEFTVPKSLLEPLADSSDSLVQVASEEILEVNMQNIGDTRESVSESKGHGYRHSIFCCYFLLVSSNLLFLSFLEV